MICAWLDLGWPGVYCCLGNKLEGVIRPEFNLDRALAYRLTRLARLLRKHLIGILDAANLDLSPEQYLLILRLADQDGLEQGALVDPMMDDRANITRQVDRLARRGLVVRRSHEDDGRRKRVFLTETGEALVTRLEPVVLGARRSLFGDLDPEDLAALERVLGALEGRL